MLTDKRGFAKISIATAGDNTIIAAPTLGHIEIDHLEFIPTGGANTVTVKMSSAAADQYAYALDDQQGYSFDRTTPNTLTCTEATAFIINLSASTTVTGFVLYRIVGA